MGLRNGKRIIGWTIIIGPLVVYVVLLVLRQIMPQTFVSAAVASPDGKWIAMASYPDDKSFDVRPNGPHFAFLYGQGRFLREGNVKKAVWISNKEVVFIVSDNATFEPDGRTEFGRLPAYGKLTITCRREGKERR